MLDQQQDFGPFDGRTWINCSHQGPLPRPAVEAAQRALTMKTAPHHLFDSRPFTDVPARLRAALGRVLGAAEDDIILGNSTSYGLNIVAAGLDWSEGDEVLVVKGDFPATAFPWLPLHDRGVTLRFIEPAGPTLTPEDVAAHVTPRTRLLCTTWIHSFTGHVVEPRPIADVCRRHGVVFVLNCSQGMGARPFDVGAAGADVVCGCGFKWLCGPYATGYCWIRQEVRETLRMTQGYWLANLTADDLRGEFDIALRPDLGARAYDVFCPANFMNYMPWTAAIEYLLDVGIENIAAHDDALVSAILDGLDRDRFDIISPTANGCRSTIVICRHRTAAKNRPMFETLREQGIDIALRRGCLRLSPHVCNTMDDIGRAVDLMNR